MKRIAIYVFAFLGILSALITAIIFHRSQKEAKEYYKNCEFVKIGMTLEQAKLIMGDFDNDKRTRSEIWTYFDKDSTKEYFLVYPMVFAGSTSPEIFFDPTTQIVTKVNCGE